ncbi:DNA polymerase I A, chloroplastic isoform X2 [Zea mays]|uniref:DNA polymerase like1 n=3 Tax=Zea mays TaxID=4577 RepID=A0A1D6IZ68_MAIZE|nr:DNA polymerase I A, chloroplastic isoform X2 [Zea mays]AQK41169.1 DNA polymerase like1 [Zea mays]|eukprot:XP_020401295.1 DNA polymerase I A, chloroplastic isoform X2 [Zea mays]
MVAAQVTPAPLLRRHGSAPPWLSSSPPFLLRRRASSPFSLHRRASPPLAISGCRRQDYSHCSDMAVRGSSAFKLRFYPNLEVQNIAQEWVKESRRLFYLRTANNVTNNIYKGNTPLWTGMVQNELSEDCRGLNYTYLNNLRERVSSKSIVNRHGNNRELIGHSTINQHVKSVPAPVRVVNDSVKCFSMPRASKVEIPWPAYSPAEDPLLDKSNTEVILELEDKVHDGDDKKKKTVVKKVVSPFPTKAAFSEESLKAREALASIYDKVLVVDDIESARNIVKLLTTKYKSFIHACDTEVANINAKEETPVGHGEVICFSIYSANSDVQAADFGNGKTCIWVDVLDGGRGVLMEFAPFFEDSSIKKVWHNYSFDSHVIENYGIKIAGFHADTMHLARLWDSSRKIDGGYSLEGLTNDRRVMDTVPEDLPKPGKTSMKTIFGRKNIRKDGSEGKVVSVEPVKKLQREDRELWICYSSLDSMSTLRLYDSLKSKLTTRRWILDGCPRGTMYDFYEQYWRPFGALLVKMETEGMLVDRGYLSEIEKAAIAERKLAADKFRKWASKYCPDAKYMNVNSDIQIRQLLFGGIENRHKSGETWPHSKTFKVLNEESVATEGKKTSKYRTIKLCSIVEDLKIDMFTPSGWPTVSGDALRSLAGKIPTEYIYTIDDIQDDDEYTSGSENPDGNSSYGTAYEAFGGGKNGKEACHAIAALCEICSIDSLISNFILPLQGDHISCAEGRIHCSLNINTETGRLSARTPNLQNQPALEKDRYRIRQAFVAAPGNSLIVADYGQAGGDFHSRTAMNMYQHIRDAVQEKKVLLEWHPQPGQEKPPVPLLKDAFGAERRKAKMLNFSIAYGKTAVGLSRDWKVSVKEARDTLKLWYRDRKEVLAWQKSQKKLASEKGEVYTLLGRSRHFPYLTQYGPGQRGHIERAAINAPVQGSAADVAMCAMLEIERNVRLKELGWRLLLQVHDEVILEGPSESAEVAKAIVVECMSKPFYGTNILNVDLAVDAKCAKSWYAAK